MASHIPVMECNERELIARAQAGDDAAIERIFRETVDCVFKITTGFAGGDRDLAKELAQKTFIQMFRHLGRINEPYNLFGWAARVAGNVGRDHWRKRKREQKGLSEYAHVSSIAADSPEDFLLAKELAEKITLIHEFEPDPEIRRTLELYYGEGRKGAEIAREQGISETVVTSRVWRFKLRLKKEGFRRALEGK